MNKEPKAILKKGKRPNFLKKEWKIVVPRVALTTPAAKNVLIR